MEHDVCWASTKKQMNSRVCKLGHREWFTENEDYLDCEKSSEEKSNYGFINLSDFFSSKNRIFHRSYMSSWGVMNNIYNNESIQNDNSILKHFACIIHQQRHKFRDYNVISIFIISTWFMSVTWATFIWSNEHRKTLYHCAVRHASKKPNVALQSTIIWEYPRIEIWY